MNASDIYIPAAATCFRFCACLIGVKQKG